MGAKQPFLAERHHYYNWHRCAIIQNRTKFEQSSETRYFNSLIHNHTIANKVQRSKYRCRTYTIHIHIICQSNTKFKTMMLLLARRNDYYWDIHHCDAIFHRQRLHNNGDWIRKLQNVLNDNDNFEMSLCPFAEDVGDEDYDDDCGDDGDDQGEKGDDNKDYDLYIIGAVCLSVTKMLTFRIQGI